MTGAGAARRRSGPAWQGGIARSLGLERLYWLPTLVRVDETPHGVAPLTPRTLIHDSAAGRPPSDACMSAGACSSTSRALRSISRQPTALTTPQVRPKQSKAVPCEVFACPRWLLSPALSLAAAAVRACGPVKERPRCRTPLHPAGADCVAGRRCRRRCTARRRTHQQGTGVTGSGGSGGRRL